jgi:hypothetical protein
MIVRKINLKLLENCCFCLKAKKKKRIIIGDKNFRKYRHCLAHKKANQRFFFTQINFIHGNPLVVTISYQITTC